MTEKLLARNYFCFNEHDNGGESFYITTKILERNGHARVQQEIGLNSYCNATLFELRHEMIPVNQLRDLANQLDQKYSQLCAQKLACGKDDRKLGELNYQFDTGSLEDMSSDTHNLSLLTEYFDNGDGGPEGIYVNQKLSLRSWGTTASIILCGTSISSEMLRKLANQLDTMLATLPQKEVLK